MTAAAMPAEAPAVERRRDRRVRCRLAVEVDGLGEPLTLTTRDVSLGGVFLYHPRPLPVDRPLALHLRAGERTLHLTGTVVHHLVDVGFGVRFDPAPDDEMSALRAFLAAVEGRQNVPPTATPPGVAVTPTDGADSSS